MKREEKSIGWVDAEARANEVIPEDLKGRKVKKISNAAFLKDKRGGGMIVKSTTPNIKLSNLTAQYGVKENYFDGPMDLLKTMILDSIMGGYNLDLGFARICNQAVACDKVRLADNYKIKIKIKFIKSAGFMREISLIKNEYVKDRESKNPNFIKDIIDKRNETFDYLVKMHGEKAE